MRRVTARVIPFVFVLYIFNFLDRSNVGLAALQMNHDLGFGGAAFSFGAGIFFVGYSRFEVPSKLLLVRLGARRWVARIMISWGVLVGDELPPLRALLHPLIWLAALLDYCWLSSHVDRRRFGCVAVVGAMAMVPSAVYVAMRRPSQ